LLSQNTLLKLFQGASHSYETQAIAPSRTGSFVDEEVDDLPVTPSKKKSLFMPLYSEDDGPTDTGADMVRHVIL
jgi:hypothetical protein